MQGIGPGTILGGRYTADDRIATYPGAERWSARDTILERVVVLFTVPSTHPNADAVLDAARRSAGLDNPRLARILDVGTTDDLAYIVEEGLDGAHSLSDLLEMGPLPAPEVRRIAGEAALLLDLARHRGLHHQQLTPDLVLRTQDGDVKLRGVAVMAALAGVDHVDHAAASREDAKAVVALAYAGFTGHWPLPGASGGLPSAPRMGAHVAAPSEIAPGVPADLDALCRLTFANDQGPVTPGDFARQIAPWSPIPVLIPAMENVGRGQRPGGSPRGRAAVDGAADAAADADRDEPQSPAQPVPSHADAGPVKVAHRVPAPPPMDARSDDAGRADDADADDAHADDAHADDTITAHASTDDASTSVDEHPNPAPATPRAQPTKPTKPTRPSRPAAAAGVAGAGAAGAAAGGKTAGAGAGAALGAGAAAAGAASAAKALSGRLSGWSSSARERVRDVTGDLRDRKDDAMAKRAVAAEARAERQALETERQERLQAAAAATATAAAASAAAPPDESVAGTTPPRTTSGDPTPTGGQPATARPVAPTRPTPRRTPAPTAARTPAAPATTPLGRGADADRLEPPAPLLPSSTAEPLTRDQSRMAIGILVGALVLALAFAVWGLSNMPPLPGLTSSDGQTMATPTETADTTEGSTGSETDAPSTDAPPQVSAPLTFVAAKDYDPLGDGAENPDRLPRILDGDSSTWWGSEGYRSSAFSNLKTGLGVVLDLGETSSISEVTLQLPGAATGSIYVTDDEGYFASGKQLANDLAKAADFSGQDTVTTELAEGTSGRYVIVWFTEISRDGDWYRARLAGASATS